MNQENKGLRFLFLILDLSLLFTAIYIINSINPAIKLNKNIYLLHAAIAEILAYTLYSKRNYYFEDNFKSRVIHITYRMLVFTLILFVFAKFFLPNDFSNQVLLEYVGLFYIFKLTFFYILYSYLNYNRKNGRFKRNIAILGLREIDILFGGLIEKNPTMGLNLIGYIADNDDYDRKDKK